MQSLKKMHGVPCVSPCSSGMGGGGQAGGFYGCHEAGGLQLLAPVAGAGLLH